LAVLIVCSVNIPISSVKKEKDTCSTFIERKKELHLNDDRLPSVQHALKAV
jgi:hypothetical protein